ncbi:hypothetical protein GGX14DRAFT_664048 [Mycena pura]|uniref:Uncharacterized protein n=1 Tax=Mycena pura TaxID=153505 RepID=A0AAD6YL34_9AGAR|nr:hypothetical protein GGX14DRAFT_664048 [Mycena pura]
MKLTLCFSQLALILFFSTVPAVLSYPISAQNSGSELRSHELSNIDTALDTPFRMYAASSTPPGGEAAGSAICDNRYPASVLKNEKVCQKSKGTSSEFAARLHNLAIKALLRGSSKRRASGRRANGGTGDPHYRWVPINTSLLEIRPLALYEVLHWQAAGDEPPEAASVIFTVQSPVYVLERFDQCDAHSVNYCNLFKILLYDRNYCIKPFPYYLTSSVTSISVPSSAKIQCSLGLGLAWRWGVGSRRASEAKTGINSPRAPRGPSV